MWLLDVNLPIALVDTLKELKITARTTESQGWRLLDNGRLVSAAATFGFTAILTRDKEFALSAAKALKQFPTMSIVIVTLTQHREKLYIAQFLEEWERSSLHPTLGKVHFWPSQRIRRK